MNISSATHPPGAKPKEWLLVVDDDAPIRSLVALCLEGLDLEVVGAESGAEALQILAGRPEEPVLALIDVMMPGIDGLTLGCQLRLRFQRAAIVFMSGHATDRSLWPAELSGLTFLAKPFRVAVLKEIAQLARTAYRQQVSQNF